jgi:SAM-dependent methyltransferase
MASLYSTQRGYFKKAYQTGEHGWPVEGPSQPVKRFLRQHKHKKERSGERVLDIGCGEGRHTRLFSEKGYFSVGLDYQPLAIARAREIGKRRGMTRPVFFAIGDVFHLPFRAGAFGILLDYGCLHHVKKSDFGRYLKSVLSVLSDGGYFLLSCFSTRFRHHPGERRRRDWLVHRGHYDRFFRKSDFRALFGRDFDILSVEEERQELYAFYHVLMRKKQAGEKPEGSTRRPARETGDSMPEA